MTASSVFAIERGKPVVYAVCPDHGRRTSVCRGQQADIEGKRWDVWRCKEKGGHLFNAKPVPGLPNTAEGLRDYFNDRVVKSYGS